MNENFIPSSTIHITLNLENQLNAELQNILLLLVSQYLHKNLSFTFWLNGLLEELCDQ
jgi:hypothetical protein